MKRTISLALVFVLCLSLCACGSESKEDVVGTYAPASGFYNLDGLVLRDDFTYDWGSEKGTYKISGDKIILTSKYNDTTTFVKQGDICYLNTFIPLENDYGQAVTFSKEGRINHEVRFYSYEGYKSESYHLTLSEDGSFRLYRSVNSTPSGEIKGTYSLESNILTLTSEDATYYLVCSKEGITKDVFKKYTTDTEKYWVIEEPLPEPPAE